MAKTKTAKKKPAKKKPAKKAAKKRAAKKPASKKAVKKSNKVFVTEGPLPPKQALKVMKKLHQMSLPPSHPTDAITGPAITLNYDAPIPKPTKTKRKPAKAAKKKR
jgi:hypothetical protein